jgi:hypothetical protein
VYCIVANFNSIVVFMQEGKKRGRKPAAAPSSATNGTATDDNEGGSGDGAGASGEVPPPDAERAAVNSPMKAEHPKPVKSAKVHEDTKAGILHPAAVLAPGAPKTEEPAVVEAKKRASEPAAKPEPASPAAPPQQQQQQGKRGARAPEPATAAVVGGEAGDAKATAPRSRKGRPEQSTHAGTAPVKAAKPRRAAKPRKIPKLPMVLHNKRWYRARLLKDSGEKVLLGKWRVVWWWCSCKVSKTRHQSRCVGNREAV